MFDFLYSLLEVIIWTIWDMIIMLVTLGIWVSHMKSKYGWPVKEDEDATKSTND